VATSKRKPVRGSGTKRSTSSSDKSPSELIDHRIAELDDWRGERLARVRALIKQADPDIVEEWKWNVPVWSHDGIVTTGEVYKQYVKTTFAYGAALPDPAGLFNGIDNGATRRTIDIRKELKLNEAAFKALIKAAVKHNQSRTRE
jgi:hypothetical protein